MSILLWQLAHVFFMPQALTNRLFPAQATDPLLWKVALTNVGLVYFGAYWVFSANWKKLKPYLRNEFLGAIAVWGVNVLVIFPIMGRGILGYKLPQGAFGPCVALFATHWIFGRALSMNKWRLD